MARQRSSMADQYRAALAEKTSPRSLRCPDIATYLLAQGVIVVARVADGQQVTVLGIEDEQEPVEENQGGLAHFLQ